MPRHGSPAATSSATSAPSSVDAAADFAPAAEQQVEPQQLRAQRQIARQPAAREQLADDVERLRAVATRGERLGERQPRTTRDAALGRRGAQVGEAVRAVAGRDACETAPVARLGRERGIGRVDERREAVGGGAREARLLGITRERALELDRGDAEAQLQQQRLGRLPVVAGDDRRHVGVALGRLLALGREAARGVRGERARTPVELGERLDVATAAPG